MKLSKFMVLFIVIALIGIFWYQASNPDKWERVVYPLEYKDLILKTSEKYAIDPYLVTAIIYEESKFNPSSESNHGAIGLMQIMPHTGQWIAEKEGHSFTADDLYSPAINIDMGCWYYSFLREKYGDEKLALAAYNSGFKNVDRWLDNRGNHKTVDSIIENIPYKETRQFVQRVKKSKEKYEILYPGEFSGAPQQ